MKRIIGFFVLAGMMILPSMVLAKEQIGLYVAPKFIGAWTMMDGMSTGWGEYSRPSDDAVSLSHIGDETEGSFGGALAIGYDFKPKFDIPLRAEIEYAYMSETSASSTRANLLPNTDWSAKQNFQAQTLFANVYYDFHNSTSFTPYVGAGLGVAFINTDADLSAIDAVTPANTTIASTGSQTETNFAWNVGVGVGYAINEMFTVDLGYRFASLGGAETSWSQDQFGDDFTRSEADNLYMHQVALGLRINF